MSKTIIGIVVTAGLVAIVWFVGSFFFGKAGEGVGTYSDGWRTGYVLKLSTKGAIKKSLEGTLLNGYSNNGIFPSVDADEAGTRKAFSNIWEFSVASDHSAEISPLLEEAAREGKRVMLFYKQALSRGLSVETDYLVYRCELAN